MRAYEYANTPELGSDFQRAEHLHRDSVRLEEDLPVTSGSGFGVEAGPRKLEGRQTQGGVAPRADSKSQHGFG